MCKPSDIEKLFSSTRYLSTKQISRRLKTTESDVLSQINFCDSVYQSFIIPDDGSKMFANKRLVNRFQDI